MKYLNRYQTYDEYVKEYNEGVFMTPHVASFKGQKGVKFAKRENFVLDTNSLDDINYALATNRKK